MARPKNIIIRKQITTTIDEEILKKLKDKSKEIGKPLNIILEELCKKSLDKI